MPEVVTAVEPLECSKVSSVIPLGSSNSSALSQPLLEHNDDQSATLQPPPLKKMRLMAPVLTDGNISFVYQFGCKIIS